MKNLSIFNQFAKTSKSLQMRTDGKAVIYTRVSSKEQAENNASLDTQKKYCKLLAEKKGIDVLEYFGGTYESAKSDERKHFQKMLNFVKRKKEIGYIIVYSYDRFSRTGANGAYISDQLKKQGIVTLSATQEVDTSTSAGSFQQNLYYMFSQFDNELRRDKCVSGMIEKLRRGHWIGQIPFGYDNLNPGNGKTPEYVINKQGTILRNAFLWKANSNMAHTEIVQHLAKKGLITTDKKLSKYFRNPFYCGLLVNSLIPGEVLEGTQEKLITKEIFLKVHNLLNSRDSSNKYKIEDENLPLKMFVRSAECDSPYTGYIVKKKGLYYYKCRRNGSKENKSAKKLHQTFIELLSQFTLLDSKYINPLKQIIETSFLNMNEDRLKESEILQKEALLIEKKLERLEERFVFEEISRTQYDKFRQKIESEKHKIETKFQNTKFNSSNLKKAIEKALQYALNLPSLWTSGDIETKRAIQYMVFPEGIGYDIKNDKFRTFRVNSIFSAIASVSGDLTQNKKENYHNFNGNSLKVESEGFEPSSKQAIKLLSTRLVFD